MTGKAPTALFGCATTLTFDVATGISDYCVPRATAGVAPTTIPCDSCELTHAGLTRMSRVSRACGVRDHERGPERK